MFLLRRVSDWLLSRDPKMRGRVSMAALGVVIMVGSVAVMEWLAHTGFADPASVRLWSVLSLGGMVGMTLMVRSGITVNWDDPALTVPQILWALSSSAFAYVLAGEAKGVVMAVVGITLMFAALNLKALRIVVICGYALCSFALAVLWSFDSPGTKGFAIEIAYAGMLAVVLVGCLFLSLRLYQLRAQLRSQHLELARALQLNRELASRDPLTGLLNRRYMLELLQLEERRCLRGIRNMLIAQLDIDHFKEVNDTYGHRGGDLALQTFADVVRNNIRSSDVLSRWGGEEFVLLLSDTEVPGALATLERIRKAVQATVVPGVPEELRLTVSMGLAEHFPGESVEQTLERADQALYRAKRSGRNQVVLGENPVAASAGAEMAQTA